MTSVLILYTCYDVDSSYTAAWARDLRDDLFKKQAATCLLYDAQYMCHAGNALNDAIERADFVVFYGHGTSHSWIALPDHPSASPGIAPIPLVDSSTVNVLKGKKIYAACCWSLSGLGNDYIVQFPQGEFVGYNNMFGFEKNNADYFKEVVNQSAAGFVRGDAIATVVANLRAEWANLRDRFSGGNLKYQRAAAMASKFAELNLKRVGGKP
jgi:hypothetical protein